MIKLKHLALAAVVASGAAFTAATPASAGIGISIGIGGPAYYGYDYNQSCRYYFNHRYPAPQRCYNEYRGFYGSGVYISDGFVFSNRSDYGRWSRRDDFRHWRGHDWSNHGGNNHGNWNGRDNDRHDGDRHDNDRHDNDRHHNHDHDNH
jgi:hypothetical protein